MDSQAIIRWHENNFEINRIKNFKVNKKRIGRQRANVKSGWWRKTYS